MIQLLKQNKMLFLKQDIHSMDGMKKLMELVQLGA
jgi:hypothetical protein